MKDVCTPPLSQEPTVVLLLLSTKPHMCGFFAQKFGKATLSSFDILTAVTLGFKICGLHAAKLKISLNYRKSQLKERKPIKERLK